MYQQDELARLIGRYATEDGVHQTEIPRLSLIRRTHPTDPLHSLHKPALCIVAQGQKQMLLGEEVYLYDRDRYLIISVDLPVVGQVVGARPDAPYLGFRLDLDVAVLDGMLTESALDETSVRGSSSGLTLSSASPELLDSAVRLVRLLEAPRDIDFLAPRAEQEVLYRLLTGEQGRQVLDVALAGGKAHQINQAIGWIKEHYREPFRVEALASEARMSSSALHHHFKAVTSMSPLQYQKQLRLQEARRLILGASLDVATAGFSVGYESPSQFSREYSRLFGAPPRRDTEKLRTSGYPQRQEA